MNLKKIINPFGGKIHYKESTTSTMVEAKSLLVDKDSHGSVFIAGFQSQGIGRIPGRLWESNSLENLTFTIVLDKDQIGHGYTTLPLKAGLALSQTVKELVKKDAFVKWPNDVIVDGKKISGILCHSNRQSILVGIGLNVNQRDFANELEGKATSLSLLTNNGFSLEMVLSRFLDYFFNAISNDNWLSQLNKSLYKVNNKITFHIGDPKKNETIIGFLRGLDSSGKVLIEDESGEIKGFLSGEIKI